MTRFQSRCRLAVTALTGLIFLLSFCGRSIERALPQFVPLIPFIGSAALIALIVAAWRALLPVLTVRRVWALAIIVIAATLSCEALIQLPVERIHFFKFVALSLLLSCGFPQATPGITAVQAFVVGALIGALDENLQRIVPSRFFDPNDLLLDATGAFFGAVLAFVLFASQRREC